MSGQVNVQAVLRHHTTVRTPKGRMDISALSLWAEDPRALVTRARQRQTADATSQDQPGG